jgi:hypothetical protein
MWSGSELEVLGRPFVRRPTPFRRLDARTGLEVRAAVETEIPPKISRSSRTSRRTCGVDVVIDAPDFLRREIPAEDTGLP